jgi:hypothetical protein
MRKFTLTFLEWGEINKYKPGTEISFLYTLIEDKYLSTSEENKFTNKNNIKVFIEGRKDASWKCRDENYNLSKILFSYVKDYIVSKLETNTLNEEEYFVISSVTYPDDECEYKSDEIEGPNNDPIKIEIPD